MTRYSKKYREASRSIQTTKVLLEEVVDEYEKHNRVPSRYILEVGISLGKAKILTQDIPNVSHREICESKVDSLESISWEVARAVYFSDNALKNEAVEEFIKGILRKLANISSGIA